MFLLFLEDGRKCNTTVTLDGENMIILKQTALEPGKKSLKIVLEFTEDGIYGEWTCEDVVCKYYFKRQI